MKKIYSKPETEIVDIEPQQMICTSLDPEPQPEDEEWFDMPGTEDSKYSGVLD